MKYLVTGGAGFIGSNLTRRLLDLGHSVVVLDNFSTGYRDNLEGLCNLTLIEGDILDYPLESLLQDVSGVFHMAASVGNVKSLEEPLQDASINILGTLRVLEAMRLSGTDNLVYSSSAATFGEPRYLPVDEEHPQHPDSPYGVSKLAGEKNAMAFARLYSMKVICLRYFNVYGRLQRFDAYGNVIPIFAKLLLADQPLKVYGDGLQTRDFVHVSDVVSANVLAVNSPGSGVFNIGSGRASSVQQLITTLAEVTGRQPTIQHEPPRRGEVTHSSTTIQSAQKQLHYRPETFLTEGLSDYMNWLSNGSL